MKITSFFGKGYFGENSFVITDEETGKSAIIDPCFVGTVPNFADFNLEWILLTHGHVDHLAQAEVLKQQTGAKILLCSEEVALARDPNINLSAEFGIPISVRADRQLKDGEKIPLGALTITVLHTPGHTAGSCCFLAQNHMFTGDTVMADSVGRTDFPTGSAAELGKSLQKLQLLPLNYILHCGHGPDTELDIERQNNPFFMNR